MKLSLRLHGGEDCDLMGYVTVQFVIRTTFTVKIKTPEGHSPKNEVNCEGTELSLCMMGNFLTTGSLPLTSLVVLKYYRQSIQTIATNKL